MEPTVSLGTLVEIAATAIEPLDRLPVNSTIFSNQTGTLTAGGLAQAAAAIIAENHEKGMPVPQGALRASQEILHGKQPKESGDRDELPSPAREAFALIRQIAENSFPGSVSDSDAFPSMSELAAFCVHPDDSLALVSLCIEGSPEWGWPIQVTSGLALDVPNTLQLMAWVNEHNHMTATGKYYCVTDANGRVSVVYEAIIWGNYIRVLFEEGLSRDLAQLMTAQIRSEIAHIVQVGARERNEIVANFGGRLFAPTRGDLLALFAVSSG